MSRGTRGEKALRVRTPLARREELVVEEAGDEVLVYDERTAEAHCLSVKAASVWRACDGQTTREQIAATLGLDAETVAQAIAELERCELLGTFEAPRADGVTRREATARLAKAGAAAAAAPLIYSIVAPLPAAAASAAFCNGRSACAQDCGTCNAGNVGCHCCCTGNADIKVCVADCGTCNSTLQQTICPQCAPGGTAFPCSCNNCT